MALNKYMHSRNIYKTPPDFRLLTKLYPEFCSIAKTDVTGKVTINFKDPHALRVLTKCLLKNDFKLDVDIPEDRLVPTLPLRLNYILWLEDILISIDRKENIRGLDIGTGACAIYPLLAAVKNKWHMIGTETDEESLSKAQENIEKNNLQSLIQVSKNTTSTLMEYLFVGDNNHQFDFSMCNPPFYSNLQELCESRSPARLPPKNGFTGSPQELITEGGELAFCRKMIKESKDHKDKVIIYTTMVGHKYSLKELVQDLKAEGIHYTTTEFCQGRVTRWGLAWTFQDFDLEKLVPGRDQSRKKNIPIAYLLPELPGIPYNFDAVSNKIISILQDLKMNFNILNKRAHTLTLDVKALENTWSNQRQKRRLMKMQELASKCKKTKLEESSKTFDEIQEGITSIPDKDIKKNGDNNQETEKPIHVNTAITDEVSQEESNINESPPKTDEPKQNGTEDKIIQSIDSKNAPMNVLNDGIDLTSNAESVYTKVVEKFLVHAFFKILKKENNILLEMEFLHGSSGKEGLHQIMQYIKNNWK